eukprot:4412015-Pleurochrysis_carterae.AAC.1
MNSAARDSPLQLLQLGRDNLELVCCFLPICAIGVFAQCSIETQAVATGEALWRALLVSLSQEHLEMLWRFEKLFVNIASGASACRCFKEALSLSRGWRYEYACTSWRAEDLSSLKELGALIFNLGDDDAQFIPFETIAAPVQTKAALELLQFLSSLPYPVFSLGRVQTNFFVAPLESWALRICTSLSNVPTNLQLSCERQTLKSLVLFLCRHFHTL